MVPLLLTPINKMWWWYLPKCYFITTHICSVWKGNVFSCVCLSVFLSNSGGVPCDFPMMHWGSSIYKQLHQARPISWCLESKEVTSNESWDGSHGTLPGSGHTEVGMEEEAPPGWTKQGTPFLMNHAVYPQKWSQKWSHRSGHRRGHPLDEPSRVPSNGPSRVPPWMNQAGTPPMDQAGYTPKAKMRKVCLLFQFVD